MAVMVWDAQAQAWRDAGNPKIWDSSNNAWKESTGLVWDSSAGAWKEAWSPGPAVSALFHLYDNGNVCSDITAGWNFKVFDYDGHYGNASLKSGYINLDSNYYAVRPIAYTANKIYVPKGYRMYVDLNYSVLGTNYGGLGAFRAGLTNDIDSRSLDIILLCNDAPANTFPTRGRQTMVSEPLKAEYQGYVKMTIDAGNNHNCSQTAQIYAVWFVKE